MIQIMIETFFSDARTATYAGGQTIFHRGSPTAWLYRVVSGRVRMVRGLSDGRELTVATANAGETFAEAALFSDNYHCDAIAAAPAELQMAPCDRIRARLTHEPELALILARYFAGQVRDLRMQLEVRTIKRAPERVLAWLKLHARGVPPTVERPGSWAKAATEIGLSSEAFYRALRDLSSAHLIQRGTRDVIVVCENN